MFMCHQNAKKRDTPVPPRAIPLQASVAPFSSRCTFAIETSFKMAFSNRFPGHKGGGWKDKGPGRWGTEKMKAAHRLQKAQGFLWGVAGIKQGEKALNVQK